MKKISTLYAAKSPRGLVASLFILMSILSIQFRAGAQTLAWEVQTHPSADIQWHSIAYGTGLNSEKLFVAVSRTALASPDELKQVMWSNSGLSGTWTVINATSSKNWFDIDYGYYSASVTNKVLSGNVAELTTAAAHDFTVGQTVIVSGVGDPFDGTYLIASVTANTFTYARTAADLSSAAVSPTGTASCGLFVAISSSAQASTGLGNDATLDKVMTSKDGKTWTSRTIPVSNAWNSLAYGNGKFVAVASSGGTGRVMYSANGISWTAVDPPEASHSWRGITFGPRSTRSITQKELTSNVATLTTSATHDFIVGETVTISGVGYPFDGTFTITAVTGSTFSYARVVSDVTSTAVSPAGSASIGLFVAVANTGSNTNLVMTSQDGITWTSRTATNDNWYCAVYGNEKFIAVGFEKVLSSTDGGITWSTQSPTGASGLQFNDVDYSSELGKFVAVAQTTSTTTPIMTSTDGSTWTMETAEPNAWRGVIYGDGRFVAVGTRTGAGKEQRHVITQVTVLPLTLVSLTVADKDCQASLEWKTAAEVNTSHFEIESSSDGRNFRSIGRVEAQGNGNGRTYGFRTAQVPGRFYYRLKMADRDGRFTYSPVKTLTMGCAGQTQLSIYPNPLTQGAPLSFRLSTGYRGNAKAELVTTEGRIIRSMALSVGLGENRYSLPATDLPAGTYTLRIISDAGEPLAEPQRVIKR